MIATRADLTDIAVSQALFHISMLLPPFLYWVCRTPDADPRFPATISWTIRRGTPKTVQHVCWLAGWLNLSPVLARDWRVLAASVPVPSPTNSPLAGPPNSAGFSAAFSRTRTARIKSRGVSPLATASDLLVLLQAPSKQSVDTFFSFAFSSRERAPEASLLAEVAAQFSCTPAQAERLEVIKPALRELGDSA